MSARVPAIPRDLPERWLPVVGHEGRYEVSDHGRVRSLVTPTANGTKLRRVPRILALAPNAHGYWCAQIMAPEKGKGRTKKLRVHVAVLRAFRGIALPGQLGRHLDGKQPNNALSNLVWGTQAENHADKRAHGTLPLGERAYQAKLRDADIPTIRHRVLSEKVKAVAADYGVTATTISYIKHRKTWRHL